MLGQPSIDRFLKPEILDIKEVPENTTGQLMIGITLVGEIGPRSLSGMVQILTFPTKVPSDSLGWIGSLKRTSDKSLFPMALGSCGHRITHQLRLINMNGRSILAVTSILGFSGNSTDRPRASTVEFLPVVGPIAGLGTLEAVQAEHVQPVPVGLASQR